MVTLLLSAVTVDGTAVPIIEPFPYSPKWYSCKLSGPRLMYEVSIGTYSTRISLVHGPIESG